MSNIFDELNKNKPLQGFRSLTEQEAARLPNKPYTGNNPMYQGRQQTPQGLLELGEENYNEWKQAQNEAIRKDELPFTDDLRALGRVVKAPWQDLYYTLGFGSETETERFNKASQNAHSGSLMYSPGFIENMSDEDAFALQQEKQNYMQNYVDSQVTDWGAYKKRREE